MPTNMRADKGEFNVEKGSEPLDKGEFASNCPACEGLVGMKGTLITFLTYQRINNHEK